MKTIHHFLLIACLSAGISDPGRGTDARRSHQRSAQRAGHGHPAEPDQPPPAPIPAPEAATNAVAAPASAGSRRRHQRSRGHQRAPPQCRQRRRAAGGRRNRHQWLAPELPQRAPEPGPGLPERCGRVRHQQRDRCPRHR